MGTILANSPPKKKRDDYNGNNNSNCKTILLAIQKLKLQPNSKDLRVGEQKNNMITHMDPHNHKSWK